MRSAALHTQLSSADISDVCAHVYMHVYEHVHVRGPALQDGPTPSRPGWPVALVQVTPGTESAEPPRVPMGTGVGASALLQEL